MLWDGFFRPFWGLKTSIVSIRFSLGMVTEFASWQHAWRFVSSSIGSFRYTGEKAAHESQSLFCYSRSFSEQHLSRICAHRAHNLLVLRSPQFSFTLGPRSSCRDKSVLVICVFLAYKQRIDNIISVKTLVQRLLGLPDLSPRVIHVEAVLIHPTHPVCVVACMGGA